MFAFPLMRKRKDEQTVFLQAKNCAHSFDTYYIAQNIVTCLYQDMGKSEKYVYLKFSWYDTQWSFGTADSLP